MQVYITKVYMFGNEVIDYHIQFEDDSNCSVFKDSLVEYMKDDSHIPCNFSINDDTVEVTNNVPIEHIAEPSILKGFYDFLNLVGFVKY